MACTAGLPVWSSDRRIAARRFRAAIVARDGAVQEVCEWRIVGTCVVVTALDGSDSLVPASQLDLDESLTVTDRFCGTYYN